MTDTVPRTAPISAGSEAAAAPRGNALPIGTRLREFEVLNVVGEGGFGIVYLAQDHTLGRLVALKEFMPASLAVRAHGLSVQIRQGGRETFELGLRSFVNEARLLAQFDLPTVVRVYQFWEDNGTAYIVMPFYRGVLLSDWIGAKARREPLPCDDEVWLRKNFLAPVLGALDTLHAVQCYHRDLAPDNILLSEDGQKPVLLDFGAARHVIGNATQKLTAFVKPGYAPIEQYGEIGDIAAKQGPWTDIYGLAAVLYHLIAGSPPPAAPTRLLRDPMPALVTIGRGRYTDQLLSAIDAGLAIRPEHRPQSVALWRAIIGDSPHEGSGSGANRLALVDYEEVRPDGATGAPSALNLDFSGATGRVLGRATYSTFETAGAGAAVPVGTDDARHVDKTPAAAAPLAAAIRASAAGEPSRFLGEDDAQAQAQPPSLYTDLPADSTGATTRQMRHVTERDETPAHGQDPSSKRQDDPVSDGVVPSLSSALRRPVGLRSTLGWIGLVGCFAIASAMWLAPPRWVPWAESPIRPEARSPMTGTTTAPPGAAAGATTDVAGPAAAALASAAGDTLTLCQSILHRAADSMPISDDELVRYEKDCIR
jgi:hypothetical protein